jgi:class 3 adenylate cyclase
MVMKHVDSKISNLALMFTDLEGSTEFYSRVGDEAAFVAVQEHFELLADVLKRHNGTLVKTMGDAVMATFTEPVNALKAALEIQRRNSALGKGRGGFPRVRIGLHCGPCHSTGDSRHVDHFGNTVNLASRVQALCEGGDVVLTDAMISDSQVAILLAARSKQATRFHAILKGIECRLELVRIETPKPATATAVASDTESERTRCENVASRVKSEGQGALRWLVSQGKTHSWLSNVMGRLSVLMALLALSSCLRSTEVGGTTRQPGLLGAGSAIALSGNGEAYGGGRGAVMFPRVVERSPGFSCGDTILGYSSNITHYSIDDHVVWSTNSCDAKGDVVFPDSSTFFDNENARSSVVSELFFSIPGRIYEVAVTRAGDIIDFSKGTYRTEAWCQPKALTDFNNIEVTIQLNPSTGARTATLYLLWVENPITHEPIADTRSRWTGRSVPFSVSRSNLGGNAEYAGGDFNLSIVPLLPSEPYNLAHLRVTLYGLESEFDLICTRAGE